MGKNQVLSDVHYACAHVFATYRMTHKLYAFLNLGSINPGLKILYSTAF